MFAFLNQQWSCLLFFFFLSFIWRDWTYYTKPMGWIPPSIVIHCNHWSVIFTAYFFSILTNLSLPHALFDLSSIFLASKAKMALNVKHLSIPTHSLYILFPIYFCFMLCFMLLVYVVFMRYFVKNLWFYFGMGLLKIPDPIRLTRTTRKKSDPNRPIPAGFSHFYYCHGLEIIIPDWHGSGSRTGQNPPEPTRAQPYGKNKIVSVVLASEMDYASKGLC
jgi:hypothetical protein